MNIIYFVPNITIAGGIFRIVSDKMNYLAENMEGRLFWHIMVMDRKTYISFAPEHSTVTY